jgi:predicted phage baseplate assembly protein
MAKLRVPHVLRTNTRAVTREDFEYLTIQASPKVARAKSISPDDSTDSNLSPGTMRVLLVPTVTECEKYIPVEKLEVPRNVIEEVRNYLDERRLLGTRIELGEPQYSYVSLEAHVRIRKGYQKQAADDIEKRLYQYINPICGGTDGTGWPFGRSLIPSEINACLQNIQNVDYIEDVIIYPVDPDTGEKQDAVNRIDVPYNGLLCSYSHEVVLIE